MVAFFLKILNIVMIQLNTFLTVCDNSGVHLVRFISTRGKTRQRICKVGQSFLISVRRLKRGRLTKIVRKEKMVAVLVRTARNESFYDGSFLKFGTNSCVLLNKKQQVLGTRLGGPLGRFLKVKVDPTLKLLPLSGLLL